MDATWIITAFVLIDTLMERLNHRSDVRAKVPDCEVVLIAVLSAKYFANHHERAVCVLRESGYLSGWIDVTRFNRRLHKLADWLAFIATSLGEIGLKGEVFVIDSLPVPICRRVRARRCKKVRGREYCGWCAAKKEKFFGFRLHLICTPSGVAVNFHLVPAAFHDLTPIHELAVVLPPGARLFGDKAYNSADDEASILAETGVRLIPVRRANMQPHEWFLDEIELREYRHTIEMVNSQCEKTGITGAIGTSYSVIEGTMIIPTSVRELIASGPLAHLTTINRDGSPQVTVVWVGIEDDEFVCAHMGAWKKVQNMQREPRVALSMLGHGKNALGLHEYLVVYGQARITEGGGADLLQRLASTYIGPGVVFPPEPIRSQPGFNTHIKPERFTGTGPWSQVHGS